MAQEEFVLPESKKITSFPFMQLSGGIILIKAQLDHFSDSLFFVLDTGSGGISLDSATVKRLNLPVAKSEKQSEELREYEMLILPIIMIWPYPE